MCSLRNSREIIITHDNLIQNLSQNFDESTFYIYYEGTENELTS